MIFLIVFLLPQNSFLQEISGENFSSIYLFLDNYFGELKDIEKIFLHVFLENIFNYLREIVHHHCCGYFLNGNWANFAAKGSADR